MAAARVIDADDVTIKPTPQVDDVPADRARNAPSSSISPARPPHAGRSRSPDGDEVHNVAVLEAISQSARKDMKVRVEDVR